MRSWDMEYDLLGEIAQLREWGNPPIIEKASSESLPDDLWWRLVKLELLGSRDLR